MTERTNETILRENSERISRTIAMGLLKFVWFFLIVTTYVRSSEGFSGGIFRGVVLKICKKILRKNPG